MNRLEVRSLRVFSVVLALTLVSSMLPIKLLVLPAELGDLIRVPVIPISHLGSIISTSIRPPKLVTDFEEESMSLESKVDFFSNEMARFRRLWIAKRQENEILSRQLEILQNLPNGAIQESTPVLVRTEISSRTPGNKDAFVEIRVPAGSGGKVLQGNCVVLGDDLLGVVQRSSRLWAAVKPMGSVIEEFDNKKFSINSIRSIIHQRRNDGDFIQDVLLQPIGNGSFEGIVPRGSAVGDAVLVNDEKWPSSVQGFYIGLVKKVSPEIEDPLFDKIIVNVRKKLFDQREVVVLSENKKHKELVENK